MSRFVRFSFSRWWITYGVPYFLKIPFQVCLLIDATCFLLVLSALFSAQPVVPMFYSLARPIEHLARKEWLFLFPILSLAITSLLYIIIQVFKTYQRLILQLFTWCTIIIKTILLLALVRILFIIS